MSTYHRRYDRTPKMPTDRGLKIEMAVWLVLGFASLLALALAAAGCASTPPTPAQVAGIEATASEAAYIGAAYDLAANPAHRPQYEAGVRELRNLETLNAYSLASLAGILDRLPAKLTGAKGALVLDIGVSLWTVAAGWFDIRDGPYVRAVAAGVLAGLDKALARPTGNGAAAMLPPLPPQCVVPAR